MSKIKSLAEKKDINVKDIMKTIGTFMITDDVVESHGYNGNFGSDSVLQDEENKAFDLEETESIPAASWMIVTYLRMVLLGLLIWRMIRERKKD
eukprot:14293484-Ditylum_brightwellii.AAC.1